MTDSARRSDGLEEVGAWVQSATRPMSQTQRIDGLQAVTLRLEVRRHTRPRRMISSLVLAGAVATGAVLFVRAARRGPFHPAPSTAKEERTIDYRVEGGEIGDGGYVRSFDAAGARLRFSEGTEVHLLAGARGRLGRVDANGARFAIEHGAAEVHVTPRTGARWLVDAGPFLIAVRGTEFTAAWDGAAERLDIDMQKGLVSVTGPVTEGAVTVRAGQHLTVNVQNQEVVLHPVGDQLGDASEVPAGRGDRGGEHAGVPSSSSPPDGAPATSPMPATTTSSSRSGTGGVAESHPVAPSMRAAVSHGSNGAPGPAPRGWATALAAGDLDGVLADAERRGLKATLAHAPAADLAALADAARYRRRTGIARRALLAERARFPGSGRARDAAFLIARIEDDSPGNGARALEWYDRYLEEAPAGVYASEALGRKMTATEKTRGIEAARVIAQDYVRRFPGGTYAAAARAFLAQP